MLRITLIICILLAIFLVVFFYYEKKENIEKIYFEPRINKLMTGYRFKFLTESQCKLIIDAAEEGVWTQKRHKYFPTIDQEVSKLPKLKFLLEKVEDEIFPKIKKLYNLEKISLDDFFIVKYDTTGDGMDKLDVHRDTSILNFVVSLNSFDDYVGGGTIYPEFNKIIKPPPGAIFLNCGKLKHSGGKIVKGVRYILIGFVNVLDDDIDKKYVEYIKYRLPLPSLEVMHNIFTKNLNIYVINLKKRTDRKKYILGNINKTKIPNGYNINVKVINADTGDSGKSYPDWKLDLSKYKNNLDYPESVLKFWTREISKAEIGCFNSHIKIIKEICSHNNNENTINLILEDDADFNNDFFHILKTMYSEVIQNDKNWDILYLGRNRIDKNNKELSQNIEHANYSYNAHCYLISNQACNKISKLNTKNKIVPYDEFLSSLSWSHPRSEINNLYLNKQNKLNIYATKKRFSWQKGYGYSDIN